jgi:hypothetical protein
MARKKKKKIDVNRGPDRRTKSWFNQRKSERRSDDCCSSGFWPKVENAFEKFGKKIKII